MRTLFLALTFVAAPLAAAQPASFDGTWSALTYRTLASEGDTTQAPSAQTFVLRADADSVYGQERRVVSIPDGAWGPGSRGGETALLFDVTGRLVEAGIAVVAVSSARGDGRTLRFRAMLTHDGERLALTPEAGPHHDPLVYYRVPVID